MLISLPIFSGPSIDDLDLAELAELAELAGLDHCRAHFLSRTAANLWWYYNIILLTKATAAKHEVAHSYDRARGLCFLAVVFVAVAM